MRSLGFTVAVVSAVTLITLGAAPARATMILPLDLPDMTARAESIISGKVVDSKSAWTADHDAIYTDVTIVVDRVLAGGQKVGERVVVRNEGGSVDGIGMLVHGSPSFSKDENVVLFLEHRGGKRPTRELYVIGMAQGKLTIVRDAAGVQHLHRNLSGLAFTKAAPSPSPAFATVDDLATEIARLRGTRK